MTEFRIYHVTRMLAKHNYELDDELFGSPLEKAGRDWALDDPQLYIKRVQNELVKVNTAIDDLAYLLREKFNLTDIVPAEKTFSLEEATVYVFHKFHPRQFSYAEILSHKLETCTAEEIPVILQKAQRQLNVLLAARDDLNVTLVRFLAYAK